MRRLGFVDTAPLLIPDLHAASTYTYRSGKDESKDGTSLRRLDGVSASSSLGVSDIHFDPEYIDNPLGVQPAERYQRVSDHSPVVLTIDVGLWKGAYVPKPLTDFPVIHKARLPDSSDTTGLLNLCKHIGDQKLFNEETMEMINNPFVFEDCDDSTLETCSQQLMDLLGDTLVPANCKVKIEPGKLRNFTSKELRAKLKQIGAVEFLMHSVRLVIMWNQGKPITHQKYCRAIKNLSTAYLNPRFGHAPAVFFHVFQSTY